MSDAAYAAETAATSANTAAGAANAAAQRANTAADNANTAATNANNARSATETATSSATEAAGRANTAADEAEAFLAGFIVEYENLSDECKQIIAQSAGTGASVITDEQGIAIIDDMASIIIAGREGGTLSDAEGISIINDIFAGGGARGSREGTSCSCLLPRLLRNPPSQSSAVPWVPMPWQSPWMTAGRA